MQRDVNFILLGLTLSLILALIGMSIYVQIAFKNMSVEYFEVKRQLEDKINELTEKEQSLLIALEELNRTELDKAILQEKYLKIVNEAADLKTQRDSLENILAKYREKKLELYGDLMNLEKAILNLKFKINQLNETDRANLSIELFQLDQSLLNLKNTTSIIQALP